jgi:predicted SAM-dependent methyltransferase
MVNEGMRLWGHVFLYDEPELFSLLRECGFSDIRRVKWGESDHPELRGLESRPDFADLIVEARV